MRTVGSKRRLLDCGELALVVVAPSAAGRQRKTVGSLFRLGSLIILGSLIVAGSLRPHGSLR
jgi:hypothetical protein